MDKSYGFLAFIIWLELMFTYLLWLIDSFWSAYKEFKKEYVAISEPHKQALRIGGGLFVFAGALKATLLFDAPFSAPFSDFFSEMFMGVGASLSAVGLFKLYEVQIENRKSLENRVENSI